MWFADGIKALLISKRFWAAVAGLIVVLTEGLGLPFTSEQISGAATLIAAWIIGDTLRPTEEKLAAKVELVAPEQGSDEK